MVQDLDEELLDHLFGVQGSKSFPDEANKPAIAGLVVGADQRYGLPVRAWRTGFGVGTGFEVGH